MMSKATDSKSFPASAYIHAMKYLIALAFFACILRANTLIAQTTSDPEIFTIVEQMPEYPGGEAAMRKFIGENLRYPKMEMDSNIQGKVVVGFIVDTHGRIRDVEVKQGASPGLDAEAMRVISTMPRWRPGQQQGKKVFVRYVIPIGFKLQ